MLPARERGLRVIYEPAAVVVHSRGPRRAPTRAGHKRYQEDQPPKFVASGGSRLEPSSSARRRTNLRRAADRHRGRARADHRSPRADVGPRCGLAAHAGHDRALARLGMPGHLLPEDLAPGSPTRASCSAWASRSVRAAPCERRAGAIGPRLAMVITCRPHTTSRWLDPVREYAPRRPSSTTRSICTGCARPRRAALGAGFEPPVTGRSRWSWAPRRWPCGRSNWP